MEKDLHSLKIDKSLKVTTRESSWATKWIVGGVVLFLLLGAGEIFLRVRQPGARGADAAGNARCKPAPAARRRGA